MLIDGLQLKQIDSTEDFIDSLRKSLAPVDHLISDGIKPRDGVSAFIKTLTNAKSKSHIYLSPSDLTKRSSNKTLSSKTATEENQEVLSFDNECEEKISAMFEDCLGVSRPSLNASFFDLGGHSLIALRLLNEIKKEFSIELELPILFNAPSIRELQGSLSSLIHLCKKVEKTPENVKSDTPRKNVFKALVKIHEEALEELLCAHGAGGNVLNFQPLSKAIGRDHSFYGLQCRGVDGVHPMMDSIEEMAECYEKEILEIQPQGPFIIGGYSGGGIVALEIASRFKAKGHEVKEVVMFDTPCADWSSLDMKDDLS